MNGMKKLLGVIGVLALFGVLTPTQGHADLRGSYGPLTLGGGWVNATEQNQYRPVDADGIMIMPSGDAGGRLINEWFTFSTRSLVPGREGVRSIYLHFSSQQSAYFSLLLGDPAADVSYFDPAWSSDGRFLAYIQQSFDGSGQAMYVQEYFVNDDFEAIHGGSYPVGEGSDSPVGSPILVATGNVRHPDWSPTGHTIAFDSNSAGSFDVYTVDVDVDAGTAGTPTRRTFDNIKAETDPTWSPNGHELAYSTNKFGPRVLEIIDLDLSSGDAGYTRLAELNFAFVPHNNPDYSSDGGSLFYDAPAGEDNASLTAIWKLNLTTQGKCQIRPDDHAHADPSVSEIVNFTNPGDGHMPFNYFVMTSQLGGAGVFSWKASEINACLLPLSMGVATDPAILDLDDEVTETFDVTLNFPPETRAAGYRCQSTNSGSIDGVRERNSFVLSPTLMGLTAIASAPPTPDCVNINTHTAPDSFRIRCPWDFRDVVARVQDLGLTGSIIPMKVTAYSNQAGRPFQGFAYVKLTSSGSAPAALLGNSPNPFNPMTRIKFSVSKAGNYSLRLYDVQGRLVKTVANGNFGAGTHEATWDGRMNNGAVAASGVYYAKIQNANKKFSSQSLKLVLTK
jgi:flagellar hook capping protein FlgD/WD40 repeat protein